MKIVVSNKKILILFVLSLITLGVITGSFLLIQEQSVRKQNDYPKKTASSDELSSIAERGYYNNDTIATVGDKTLESLVFIDTTLETLSENDGQINMTLGIRSYEEIITYSFSETQFFIFEDFQTKPTKKIIDVNNYNNLIVGNKYQAIFLYSSSDILFTREEINELCNNNNLDTVLESFCYKMTKSSLQSPMPYQQYLDDLRIEDTKYLDSLIFVGYLEI